MSSKKRTATNFTPRHNRLATSITLALLAGTAFPATGWAATIQGHVFEDLNQNGVKDTGEPARANAIVYLNNNTLLDAGKGGDFTARTDANGFYSSTAHTPGRFTLWTDVPDGWRQTSPAKGDGIVFYDMEIVSATQTATVNFGLFNPNPASPLQLNLDQPLHLADFTITKQPVMMSYTLYPSGVTSMSGTSQMTAQFSNPDTRQPAKIKITGKAGQKVRIACNNSAKMVTTDNKSLTLTGVSLNMTTQSSNSAQYTCGSTNPYLYTLGSSDDVIKIGGSMVFNNVTAGQYSSNNAGGVPISVKIYDDAYPTNVAATVNIVASVTVKNPSVANTAPTVKLNTSTLTASLNQAVTFNGVFTDPDVGNTYTFKWDFGDGSAVATTQNATHTYTAKGTYTATFTVTDSQGGTNTGNVTVTINGAAPVVNANTGGDTITINAGESIKFNFPFTDADGVGPYNYVFKFGDGNSASGRVPAVGNIAIQEHPYLQVGTLTATLEVTDKEGNKGTRQVTIVVKAVNADPCLVTPTVQSARPWGNWDNPTTWNTGEIPGKDDWVLIQNGNTVVLPRSTTQVEVGGLCIQPKGTLQSAFNALGSPSSTINLRTSVLHNQGRIKGAEGVNASPVNGTYMRATAGSNIKLYAYKVINDETGYIGQRDNLGGRGGDDILYNYFSNMSSQAPAVGGNGGWVEIYPEIIINDGIIQAGDGGGAITNNNSNPTVNNANNPWWPWWNRFSGLTGWNWWWNRWGMWNWWWGRFGLPGRGSARGDKIIFASAYGGQGGSVRVSATNLAESINGATGKFVGGDGGFAFYHIKKGGAPGNGGNISVNLGSNFGTNGTRGGWAWWEPLTLQTSNTTRFEGQDNIVIFGDEGASIDFTQLAEGAITAEKTITIAAGKGGTVDLRGISSKVFNAGEKVEIFADKVQLDEGVTLQDLAEAPSITVSPSKIIYVASWSNEEHVVGEPTATLPVHLTLLNGGPTEDTYTITVSHSGNATLGELPETITVEGLRRTDLTFDVKLPATRGEEDVITVTATSQGDATVKAVANVRVGVVQQEAITPRQAGDAPADITLVIDNTDSMGGEILAVADALENYFGAIDPNTSPTVELITFKDQDEVISRVVTKDFADVIGRIRSIQPAGGGDCPNASVTALEKALAGINPKGQIILATAASAEKNANEVVSKLQAQGVKVNVLLAGTCDNEATDKAFYQTITDTTGGTFTWLPRGETTPDGQERAAVLAQTTANLVADTVEEVIELKDNTTGTGGTGTTGTGGDYKAAGTLTDKFGNPIPGVTVQLGGHTTTTDDQGHWEINNLPAGEYTAVATKPGWVFANQTCAFDSHQQQTSCDFAKPSSVLKLKVSSSQTQQGENLSYLVTLTNTGTDPATGIMVKETLPANTTLVALESLNGGTCDADTLTCTLPDLAPGQKAQLKVTVNNTQSGKLENLVTVTSDNYPADMVKTATVVKPYLSVTVTDSVDPVPMMGQLHQTYDVALNANATSSATGVTLAVKLPAGVEVQTATTATGPCDLSQLPTMTCVLPTLDVNSHQTVNADFVLKDPGLLVLTTEAKVTADNYLANTVRERTHIFVPDDLKVDAIFILDTTASMQQEINGVKAAVKTFIDNLGTTQSPTLALITFKDEVKVEAFTQDPKVLLKVVEGLKVSGGGLCPEASVEALTMAVKHLKEGGTLLLSTDASPYDDADVTGLATLLDSQNMKFHALITGDCSQEGSWNELTK